MAGDVENHHPLASAAMVDLSRSTVTDTSFTSLMTGPLWGNGVPVWLATPSRLDYFAGDGYTPPVASNCHKNHETPRLTAPVAGGHIRQKEKRHETA